MLYQNLPYHWNPDYDYSGRIVLAAGLTSNQFIKRLDNKNYKIYAGEFYFDPQFYLIEALVSKVVNKSLKKLATYPFYHLISDLGSDIISENDILNSSVNFTIPDAALDISIFLTSLLEYQLDHDCSEIILPIPSIDGIHQDLSVQFKWLQIIKETFPDYLDRIIISINFLPGFLNNKSNYPLKAKLIDYLTAQTKLFGYYFTVTQTNNSNRITNQFALQLLFDLSTYLGNYLNKKVIFNFVDDLGFILNTLGASGFGVGYYTKERRLIFDDYLNESDFGTTLPYYYSSSLFMDFKIEKELIDIINTQGILEKSMSSFYTSISENSLKKSIQKLNKPVPAWLETQSNTREAREKRYQEFKFFDNYLSPLNLNDQSNFILNRLKNSKNLALNYFVDYSFYRGNPLHTSTWYDLLYSHIAEMQK